MGVTLDVPPGVLEQAGRAWDDAHDKLTGAGARLDGIVLSGLSTAVEAAVTTFLEVWLGEAAVLSRQASSHSAAFADLDGDLGLSDAAEAERLRSLLPYAFHDAPIEGA